MSLSISSERTWTRSRASMETAAALHLCKYARTPYPIKILVLFYYCVRFHDSDTWNRWEEVTASKDTHSCQTTASRRQF